jgi:tRNA-dihydrouridine synthase C
VANGEVWTPEDAQRCLAESGCNRLMLGRGMVAHPGLAHAIRGAGPTITWSTMLPLIQHFWVKVGQQVAPRHQAGRLKQWLNFLRRHYPEAELAYQQLRAVQDPEAVSTWLASAQLP